MVWIQLGLEDGLGYEFVVNMISLCVFFLAITQSLEEVSPAVHGANMFDIIEVRAPKTPTQGH